MKPRRSTLDLALDTDVAPCAGDLMVGRVAVYRILEARPVDSKKWGNRWALVSERGPSLSDWEQEMVDFVKEQHRETIRTPDGEPTIWALGAYKAGESPQDYFGDAWPPPPSEGES